MNYVIVDDRTGTVSWDAYFEYLRSVQQSFPADLYAYAADWGHYSLDGKNSLHDTWLIGVQIGFRESEVAIELLGAKHDRKHVFNYSGVKAYAFNLSVEFRFGDRDVLAHEFRLDDGGLVVHEILFQGGNKIQITAQGVMPTTVLLS